MMKSTITKYATVIAFALCGAKMLAQTKFSGNILGAPQTSMSVIIEYFQEDGWKNLTTIKEVTNGKFDAVINFDHTGQYRIRMSTDPKKWSDFILVKGKIPANGYDFSVKYADLSGKPLPLENSAEFNAYSIISELFNEVTLNPDSLPRESILMLQKEKLLSLKCTQIALQFPGTYSAEVLSKILPLNFAPSSEISESTKDSVYKFTCEHAFDNLLLNNDASLNHIGLIRRLNLGYSYFESTGKPEQFIDALMKKALVSEEMTAFMFKFLLDKMIDYKNENGLSYLITWYSSDCSESEHVESATKNLLTALEKCKPGNTIEYLNLPNLSGKLVSSKNVISSNKVTILMFWKGTCSHCKEFHPELKRIYEKYHAQGLEIYGIGTDKLQEDWTTQAKANNSPWPDVFLSFENRKDFSKRFPVSGTPSFIAVDKNGKILRRMIMRSKFEEAVVELMKEAQ